MTENKRQIDEYHFVSPDIHGEPSLPRSVKSVLKKSGEIFVSEDREDMADTALGLRNISAVLGDNPFNTAEGIIKRFSPEEEARYLQELRNIFRKYQGPGGP